MAAAASEQAPPGVLPASSGSAPGAAAAAESEDDPAAEECLGRGRFPWVRARRRTTDSKAAAPVSATACCGSTTLASRPHATSITWLVLQNAVWMNSGNGGRRATKHTHAHTHTHTITNQYTPSPRCLLPVMGDSTTHTLPGMTTWMMRAKLDPAFLNLQIHDDSRGCVDHQNEIFTSFHHHLACFVDFHPLPSNPHHPT
jgi:hypothetical protein